MSVEDDKAAKRKAVGAKVMAEVFLAAQAAFRRWKSEDGYERFFQLLGGELQSSFGRSAGLHMPSEAMVREEAAQELRDAAEKLPKGSSKRAAFMEAADIVEQGPHA